MPPDPQPGPVVRRAAPADLQRIGRLGVLLVEEHHGFDPRRFLAAWPGTPADYASFLGTQLEDPDVAVLDADDRREGDRLRVRRRRGVPLHGAAWARGPGLSFRSPAADVALEEVEDSLVRQAVSRSGGNQTRAAELLRISRDQLRYRPKKLDSAAGGDRADAEAAS